MFLFTRLSILKKFVVAFSVLLLVTASLGAFSWMQIDSVVGVADGLEANIAGTTPIISMGRSGLLVYGYASEAAATADSAKLTAIAARIADQEKSFADQWQLYEPTMDPGQETSDGDGFRDAFQQLSADAAKVLSAAKSGSGAVATALITGEMASLRDAFNARIVDDLGYQSQMAAGHAASIRDARYSGTVGVVAALAAAILAGCGLVWLLITNIGLPISRMTKTMGRLADGDFGVQIPDAVRRDEIGDMARAVEIFRENGMKIAAMTEVEAVRVLKEQKERSAMMTELQRAFGDVVDAAVEGDLTRRVNTEFPDPELNALASSINSMVERVDQGISATGDVLSAMADADLTRRVEGAFAGKFGRLRDDTNRVAERLRDLMEQVHKSSRSLKTATAEILSGANDLAERTTRQASSIQGTSTAVEQLSTTVKENAQRAEEAADKTQTVSQAADKGGAVMREARAAMERITASSGKISSVIGLIDDIAFQTNLLALNASVEAARAGDAGQGFAVVAIEVRRLAQSAARASQEVKSLVEQSETDVVSGSRLVAEAAARLEQMTDAVAENLSLVGGIASASRAQAASIGEVTSAIRQMDEMTQHNAALVEEMNAAIEQTENQANELDAMVGIFKFTQEGADKTHRPKTSGIKRGPGQGAARAPRVVGNAAVKEDDWATF